MEKTYLIVDKHGCTELCSHRNIRAKLNRITYALGQKYPVLAAIHGAEELSIYEFNPYTGQTTLVPVPLRKSKPVSLDSFVRNDFVGLTKFHHNFHNLVRVKIDNKPYLYLTTLEHTNPRYCPRKIVGMEFGETKYQDYECKSKISLYLDPV